MSLIGLPTVTLPEPATVSLAKTYDVLIVGSGAAGGMAAHALTSHGLDVLLLEAGRQVDFEAEVRALEWAYDPPRRGNVPPAPAAASCRRPLRCSPRATKGGSSRLTRRP